MSQTDIYVLPDVQVRPGDALDHLDWIAKDIVRRKPTVFVCMGDFWDLPSLSTHDLPGSAGKENARLRADVDAGMAAMERLMEPIKREQARISRRRIKRWPLRLVFTEGNHENRADRFADRDPTLTGVVGAGLCNVEFFGFERFKFLEPVEINGVYFAHYWQSSHSARPIGGTIDNRLNKLCASFVCAHEQGLKYGNRPLPTGRTIHGIVAGSCYLGTEDYRGPQARNEWRGTVVMHDVQHGEFAPMFLDLPYLCREYAKQDLMPYMRTKYPERDWSHLERRAP
jgi:hypothetical protein